MAAALRKCILSGPYKPTTVLVQAVDATDDSLAILEHTTVETPMNMSPENKAHFEAEKEAIHLILTGIRDEIYSTVDACQTEGSKDEGPNFEEEEEAAPEGQQQQAVQVVDTTIDEPLGLGYEATRRRTLELTNEKTPSTFRTRHIEAQRATMWYIRYEDHRWIHDLLVQNAVMQRFGS
nr:hypothetical protein [Tanacetum cinerariifolium]